MSFSVGCHSKIFTGRRYHLKGNKFYKSIKIHDDAIQCIDLIVVQMSCFPISLKHDGVDRVVSQDQQRLVLLNMAILISAISCNDEACCVVR